MQKGIEISFYDMLRHIIKRWPVLLVIAIIAGAAGNIYGYHKASVAAERERIRLENYAAALGTTVDKLPDHMTGELADLRGELTEEEATFVEAVAKLYMYRMWASDRINAEMDVGTPDANDLEIVQTLYYANESVQSATNVMTSAQKSYYNVLVRELSGTDMGTIDKDISSPGMIQPKWIIIGTVLGLFLGVCYFALAYMMSGKLRLAKDMEEIYGIPVLATVKQTSAAGLESVSKGVKRLLDNKNLESLAVCFPEEKTAQQVCQELIVRLEEEGIKASAANSTSSSFVGDVSDKSAVLFVEQVGKSRYRDIEACAAACRHFQIPTAGCVVIE